MPQSRYPLVQALRAIAALSVALHHVLYEAVTLGGESASWANAIQSAMPWEAGVDIFFVISGFVILHASTPLFEQGWPGLRRFLARRVARIVPLYWAVTTLYIVGATAGLGTISGPMSILASYAFIPFARPNSLVQPVFALGWTLNNEMFFYALFAAVLWMRRERAIVCLTLVLGGLVAANATFGFTNVALKFWSEPIVLEFLLGIWIRAMLPIGFGLPLWTRIGLAALALLALYADVVSEGVSRPVGWGIPAALLVIAAVTATRERASRWTSFATRIGDASYALYLLHPFVMRAMGLTWRGLGPTSPGWALIFVGRRSRWRAPLH
ncbi:MAG: acyltransferase [Acetobacteraceae bacterium]|nr:acyltransferase [Acetobacteraceae bacterium]